MTRLTAIILITWAGAVPFSAADQVFQTVAVLEEVEVVGITPVKVGALDGSEPFNVQSFSREALQRNRDYSIAGFLDRYAGSISVNDAQNNILQPDVRFRGYVASPLLGSSQGMVVYFNGVRLNETFGDTVNWDLLPGSALASAHLVAGSNPVFGQNALGGALVIEGNNGFTAADGTLTATSGSFDRRSMSIGQGVNNGMLGFYLAAEYFAESGWRDYSDSEAASLYSVVSRHTETTEFDLSLNLADTRLQGNGASPVGLLADDREAVFTHPDRTENTLAMLILEGDQQLSDNTQVSANLFYRRLRTDSFNGDGSDNEECPDPDDNFLCTGDDGESGDEEWVEDQFGNPVSSDFNAVNNISRRDQDSWGAAVQWYRRVGMGNSEHHIALGGDYLAGRTRFDSRVEYALLTEQRSTTRSGLFNPEEGNALDASTDGVAAYITDTVRLQDWQLLLSLRYNRIKVSADDRSGERPELTASHRYRRWNGGAGASYFFSDHLVFYSGIYQTSRAPTPIELACSHVDAPCNLPNTFLADPPLKDVVARSLELGLRGRGEHGRWNIGLFHTENRDDIHFQTTGGVSSNQGFFTNIGDTLFRGLEAGISLTAAPWTMTFNYTFLDATYRDDFIAFSPNHPVSMDGALPVAAGASIPGIPEHNAKLLIEYQWSETWRSGFDINATSGVYLRGDEANRDAKTDAFVVLNAWVGLDLTESINVEVEVKNLLDEKYERFGLYGEADEVIDDIDDDPRFLSPATPRSVSLSVTFRW